MCGILAALFSSNQVPAGFFRPYLDKLSPRGPDDLKEYVVGGSCSGTDTQLFSDVYLGFTRLSINDLSTDGMQPMRLRFKKFGDDYSIWLICNGEIFNHRQLVEEHKFVPKSKSDCEVILHLYWELVHGDLSSSSEEILNTRMHEKMSTLLNALDGEFAFVIYDEFCNSVVAARDNFGVRPLFWGINDETQMIAFASELKALGFCQSVKQFLPGSYNIQKLDNLSNRSMGFPSIIGPIKYCSIGTDTVNNYDEHEALRNINRLFRDAVKKRLMTERPLCCLLSGGLDSSLVAALVASHYPPHTLNTFSIGLKGSPDLMYAQKVADFIKSNHHSIELTQDEFLAELENTVETIESYDTTSVRASVGNLLVSKYIRSNTDFKVVFNGDYSDEVCGGYRYMWNAPSPSLFDKECRGLVNDICFFDSLRSDRTISSQGLEARVPFADKDFVQYYINLPPEARMPRDKQRPEKYLLRKAFESDNLLPPEVLWRPKEAFSDGVSKSDNSWHSILNEYVDFMISDDDFKSGTSLITINKPMLKETFYYRKIFEEKYGEKYATIIPYYWLPRWCGNLQDPSAREIKH